MKRILTILLISIWTFSACSEGDEPTPQLEDPQSESGHTYGEENEASFSDTYGGDVEG